MTITLTWVQIVWAFAVVGAWSGFLVAIIRALIVHLFGEFKRTVSEDNASLKKRQDETYAELRRVDNDVKRLLVELPLHYHRREDAIREYTAMNVKLDRLHELLSRKDR